MSYTKNASWKATATPTQRYRRIIAARNSVRGSSSKLILQEAAERAAFEQKVVQVLSLAGKGTHLHPLLAG